MSRSGMDIAKSENTSKFIQHRITNVEKHFGDLCQGLGNYMRQICKLRDSGDDVARYMISYAEKETYNSSTKDALLNFSGYFAAVQDYRESEIRRLDNKVLGPLTEYGTECKHAKEEFNKRPRKAAAVKEKLKQAFHARDKELKEQKNLNKAKARPNDHASLSNAELGLQKASIEASRASHQLENEMEVFEKRKLEDIKKIFLDFVNIEMMFHAKSLEMYTQCYQSLMTMHEDEDLDEFRNSLRPPSSQSRLENMRAGSRTSLNTTGVSGAPSAARTTPANTPSMSKKSAPETPNDTLNTKSSSMYTDTQDDEETETDEEESEEESESETDNKQKYQPRR